VGALVLLVQSAPSWARTGTFSDSISVPQVFIAAWFPYFLLLMQFLDRKAEDALIAFGPALDLNAPECADLKYQLTTLPSRQTLVASLGSIAIIGPLTGFIPGGPQLFARAGLTVDSLILLISSLIVLFASGGFFYHTLHQLRLVSHIYASCARINLLKLAPLYAFSRLTAQTAILGIILPGVAGFVFMPELVALPIFVGAYSVITILAAALFVVPLFGVHRLLVDKKERRIYECADRLEATITKLHERVDSGNLEGMNDLNTAMAILEMEQATLEKIPTWPWRPGTLRGMIAALSLPTVLWLVQWVLQRTLGE
jgi:hypothetical protein